MSNCEEGAIALLVTLAMRGYQRYPTIILIDSFPLIIYWIMIPRFDVPVTIEVDINLVKLPSKKILNADGLVENRSYTRFRGITWEVFKNTFELEGKALDYIDSKAKTIDDFEDMVESIPDLPEWEGLSSFPPLDLGIASTVFALYAFKCFPIASCRGHPEGTGSEAHPLVVFFSKPEIIQLLIEAAKKTGVGLNMPKSTSGALMVYAPSINDMRNFSIELYNISKRIRHSPSDRKTK